MKVIVDTSVWSIALRHRQKTDHVNALEELISDGRVVLLGAIRQELLSGIRHEEQYEKLKLHLRAFPDLIVQMEDYEKAAEYFNLCRKKGIQGSNTDFLICAAANLRDYSILTTDGDFKNFSRHVKINLLKINSR